ncbi:hypothetical protein [Escherichia coli]|uniref:hypothetical protein n=1 Tax=Escherichia coli TaxID=562 RepID=UPI00128F95B9|nr:hypothetical protein [Escherichia coli]EGJ7505805.1 hypothetical protein [Escherichia coli]MQK84630.1 hypothetical protein [Escherichia coli]MWJ62600.1 hypothetical protein [Escherichia coli]MWK02354.1 hypothetical protein [Escherichia coli]CAD5863854.1 putative phage regulatory protein [Escherichia coli]
METVISVLSVMGKATAREIAARLKIEPVEALTMLREQEESGTVTFINGYWDIASNDASVPKIITAPAVTPKRTTPPRKSSKVVRGAEPSPVTPKMVIDLLTGNGSMNTSDLAELLKRNPRGLGTTLRHFSDRGLIVKNGSGKGVTWSCIPTTPEAVHIPASEVTAKKEQKYNADDLAEPALHGACPDDLLIPNVRFISNEIRRTKAKLERLYKLRDAAREVSKQNHGLKRLGGRVSA